MKLISKKEVQALRTTSIDKANLEKMKLDEAKSKSLKEFNEWKDRRKYEEYQIEQDFRNKINQYNNQIDDLLAEISELRAKREFQMIPINQIMEKAQNQLKEAEQKRSECEKTCKELEKLNKINKEVSDNLDKKEQKLQKQEQIIIKEAKKSEKERESIRLANEKLFQAKLELENKKIEQTKQINEKLDEVRIKWDEIKAQLNVLKEQRLQNMKDQAKILSDRHALNSGWDELKKLKEKYDRR